MWITEADFPLPYFEYFARHGRPIAYSHVTGTWPIEAFQTTYARAIGSSEMPSAGRPFTSRMIQRLTSRGIEIATVTLARRRLECGTRRTPTRRVAQVSPDCAVAVRRAMKRGRRIVAVGTTVVRALESSLDRQRRITASRGWTSLHITPDRPMRVVDAIVTGFHEPTSTHLAILESIAGREHIERSYRIALEQRYLWHEFGDSHLILSRGS